MKKEMKEKTEKEGNGIREEGKGRKRKVKKGGRDKKGRLNKKKRGNLKDANVKEEIKRRGKGKERE